MADIDVANAVWYFTCFSFDEHRKSQLEPGLKRIDEDHDLYICPSEDLPDRLGTFYDLFVVPRQDLEGFMKSSVHIMEGDYQGIGVLIKVEEGKRYPLSPGIELIVRSGRTNCYDIYLA